MDSQKIKNAMELSVVLQSLMGRTLPFTIMGLDRMLDDTQNPDAAEIRVEAEQTLAGTLIVYLFAVWDEFVESKDVQQFFRPEEKEVFYAYKHIRIVAAHNINGSRKSNRTGKDRMDHAEKLDSIMASATPFVGVTVNDDTMSLKLPDAVLGCRQFMQDMALKLPGRISVGGPYGKVRGTGGSEHDVM